MTMPKFEPVAFLFQHEDTGLTSAVDVQQVEWGFEKNNPRHINCGPLYTADQLAESYEAGKRDATPEGYALVPRTTNSAHTSIVCGRK